MKRYIYKKNCDYHLALTSYWIFIAKCFNAIGFDCAKPTEKAIKHHNASIHSFINSI